MSLFLATLVVLVFAVAIERLGLAERSREVVTRAQDCVRIVRDDTLDDDAKATGLQRQAIRLFGLFGIFAGGGLLAILLPLGAIWLLDRAGVASFSEVLSILERLDFLVAAMVVGTLTYLLARRLARR
jgi:hypothetical protein